MVSSTLYREYAAGCAAGAANVITGYPFDTVKVHLQTARPGQYSSALACASQLYGKQGVRGFFHGASTPLIGGAIECGVNYTVYSTVLRRLYAGSVDARPSLTHCTVAAAAAGGVLSLILAPVELVKCRLQLQRAYYASPLQCVRRTVADEGVRGLTRGLGATLAREVPGNAIFFVSYEAIKRALTSESPGPGDAALADGTAAGMLRAGATMVLSGGLAGSIMWGLVLPIDNAKTRIQTSQPGARDVGLRQHLQAVFRQGGVRSLWAGLGPTLIRAFPANAAQWIAWELSMRAMPA